MKIKSVLALLLVLLMCLSFVAGCNSNTDKNETNSASHDEFELEVVATSPTDGFLYSDEDLFSDKDDVFNILLLGIDEVNDLGVSDTIMLLSVSKAQKKIKFVSFMEDTSVSIPGYTTSYQLKTAYSLGGAKLAVQTVQHNFGVKIHRYALLNYFTFEDMVNILGGVELNLTTEDINYINDLMKVNGEGETIDAQEGLVTLNGMQALCHMRNCGGKVNGNTYEGDDFTRGEKQRAFVEAVVGKLANTSADKLVDLANNIAPFVNTDLTMSEKSLFVANILTYLDYSVEGTVVPCEGSWSYNNEAQKQIIINDWTAVRNDLESFMG